MDALKHCRDRHAVLPTVRRALLWWALLALSSTGFCDPVLQEPLRSGVPSPLQFSPSPFALPTHKPSLDSQLTALLKRFDAIASGEVVVSGDPGGDLSLQIVVEPQAGARLDAQTLESLVSLIVFAAPGLAPERLNIAASDGRMLVRQGAVVEEAPHRAPSQDLLNPPLLAAVALTLFFAGWWVLRQRRPWDSDGLNDLVLRRHRQVARWLRDERPEMAGLVLSALGPGAAGRLRRSLRAEGAPHTPPGSPQPAAQQVIRQMLVERFGP